MTKKTGRKTRYPATSRTLDFCRKLGWHPAVVERLIPRPGRPFPLRKDLFGFIDLVVIQPGIHGLIGLQCTASSNGTARIAKIVEECHENAHLWLDAGQTIEVWDWRKYKHGLNQVRWHAKRWSIQQWPWAKVDGDGLSGLKNDLGWRILSRSDDLKLEIQELREEGKIP